MAPHLPGSASRGSWKLEGEGVLGVEQANLKDTLTFLLPLLLLLLQQLVLLPSLEHLQSLCGSRVCSQKKKVCNNQISLFEGTIILNVN